MSTAASQNWGRAAAVSSTPSPTAVATRPRPVETSDRASASTHARASESTASSERAPDLGAQQLGDGDLQRVGIAEVAREQSTEHREVLHEQRLVEPVVAPDLVERLLRCLRAGAAEDRLGGIAGDQPDREEGQRRHRPHDEDGTADEQPQMPQRAAAATPGAQSMSHASEKLGVDTVGIARAPCTSALSRKLFCWSYSGSR